MISWGNESPAGSEEGSPVEALWLERLALHSAPHRRAARLPKPGERTQLLSTSSRIAGAPSSLRGRTPTQMVSSRCPALRWPTLLLLRKNNPPPPPCPIPLLLPVVFLWMRHAISPVELWRSAGGMDVGLECGGARSVVHPRQWR